MTTASRLLSLRTLMQHEQVDATIIPSWDAYQNEYTPDYARFLPWISGFTGSNGLLVVTLEQAALFTDGRYLLQANRELAGSNIEVLDLGQITPQTWLNTHLIAGTTLAMDGWLFSVSSYRRYQEALPNCTISLLSESLVARLWNDRPSRPATQIVAYPEHYAGCTAEQKLQTLLLEMEKKNITTIAITAPDEVCWLLNIRGNDVPYTPFALLYALVDNQGRVRIYGNIAPCIFLPSFVTIHSLSDFISDAERCAFDPATFPSIAWTKKAGEEIASLCSLPKACKTSSELQAIRNAHHFDGFALSQALYKIAHCNQALTETAIADILRQERSCQPEFVSESFATIAGFNANGAIIHYHATAETDQTIEGEGILLIDSGGQYWGGTTDVTRTLAWGQPAEEAKRHYTLVLKGHIALASAVFPEGIAGHHLDALARLPLWQEGYDYPHGTGHGVGCFLSVHEGPQRISKASSPALLHGMVLSNEPGYYKEGAYGIRLESLMVVIPHSQPGFLCFETLTLAPFDPLLIDSSMLTLPELNWLNHYHHHVWEKLHGLSEDTGFKAWLKKQTAPLGR